MTTLIERKRLKDTIIENVSKNVKRVSILCSNFTLTRDTFELDWLALHLKFGSVYF